MNRKLGTFLLALPGLAWWALFLITPVVLILTYAFFHRGAYGGIVPAFTFDNLARVFDGLYAKIFLDTVLIATKASLIALLIGYPAAFAISRAPRKWQMTLLFLVILPFWSNYLIRTYAWIVLLNRTGLINNTLISFGIISEPLDMLYSEPAVIVGLVYNYLPFVVLTVYASIQRLNDELIEASFDLGASGWTTFRRVIFPLTLPGIAAGGVFVFVLSIGNFVTPDLLGGRRVTMIGNLIQNQFTSARDWPFGSALALVLLTIMVGLLIMQSRLQSRMRKLESTHA